MTPGEGGADAARDDEGVTTAGASSPPAATGLVRDVPRGVGTTAIRRAIRQGEMLAVAIQRELEEYTAGATDEAQAAKRQRAAERRALQASRTRSANTLRAYASGWSDFETWCLGQGVQALPASPDNVVFYLADRGHDLSLRTVRQRLDAIRHEHHRAGLPFDTKHPKLVRQLDDLALDPAKRAPEAKQPITDDMLRAMLVHVPRDTRVGKRDRALLLLGFVGAFRRSELVGVHVAHVTHYPGQGLQILVPRSKGNRRGKRRDVKWIPVLKTDNCPVAACLAWIEASHIVAGPIFRGFYRGGQLRERALTDRMVAELVKRCAAAAGFDVAVLSGHSLRRGFATSATDRGASLRRVQDVLLHASRRTTEGYISDGALRHRHPARRLKL